MSADGPGELLQWFDPRAHDFHAPLIEKLSCPGGRVVVPELLEVFCRQENSNLSRLPVEKVTVEKVTFALLEENGGPLLATDLRAGARRLRCHVPETLPVLD